MMLNYDNATTVANEEQILKDFQKRSQQCYQNYPCIQGISYAQAPRTCLDLFPVQAAKKTVIFIHGGYWQWCDKSDFAFITPYVIEQQMQCVLLEYDLAPTVSLTDIVKQVKQAIDFITQQPWMTEELILVGHSAGAHLAAVMLDHPRVNRAVLLSGIYDLQPIQQTPLNQALQLNEWEIQHLSPYLHSDKVNKPYEIYCGDDELTALRWQSQQYFKKRHALDGDQVQFAFIPDTNHYTILDQYFQHYLH